MYALCPSLAGSSRKKTPLCILGRFNFKNMRCSPDWQIQVKYMCCSHNWQIQVEKIHCFHYWQVQVEYSHCVQYWNVGAVSIVGRFKLKKKLTFSISSRFKLNVGTVATIGTFKLNMLTVSIIGTFKLNIATVSNIGM